MGLPLGPTFANILMRFRENMWLKNCPEHFKPIFYQRCVGDTFLLFRDQSHANLFLEYLNRQHPNIHFSMECELDGSIFFFIAASRRFVRDFCMS